MPLYSYECSACGTVHDLMREMKFRGATVMCKVCGAWCKRIVERCNVVTFQPYYDEGLGSDVYSLRDKRALMKLRGVEEAGDPVHGARDVDWKAPHLADKQPVKGVRPRVAKNADFPVSVVDGAGKEVDRRMFSELPSGA